MPWFQHETSHTVVIATWCHYSGGIYFQPLPLLLPCFTKTCIHYLFHLLQLGKSLVDETSIAPMDGAWKTEPESQFTFTERKNGPSQKPSIGCCCSQRTRGFKPEPDLSDKTVWKCHILTKLVRIWLAGLAMPIHLPWESGIHGYIQRWFTLHHKASQWSHEIHTLFCSEPRAMSFYNVG